MAEDKPFSGFTKETVSFFNGLRRHNNRDWFESRRGVYEAHVMAPAKAFVVAMGEKLRTIAPRIVAVPKVNKSIFRINRDTRFSLDPAPYKTNLGLYFWEGVRPRMESSGFYFHFEPPEIWLGGGMYMIPEALLGRFRKAVVDPKLGRELTGILAKLRATKGLTVGGEHYKRIPAGYDASHPNAELLKYNGLHAGFDAPIPEEFYSARFVDYCFERFDAIAPLHRWLTKLTR